jgi:hypothetical protein
VKPHWTFEVFGLYWASCEICGVVLHWNVALLGRWWGFSSLFNSVSDINIEPSSFVSDTPQHDFAVRMVYNPVWMYNTFIQNHVSYFDGKDRCAQLEVRNCGGMWWSNTSIRPSGCVIFR